MVQNKKYHSILLCHHFLNKDGNLFNAAMSRYACQLASLYLPWCYHH
jgi:exosome complex RNA-binding protein Rrp42 (RNase PH superfamily)